MSTPLEKKRPSQSVTSADPLTFMDATDCRTSWTGQAGRATRRLHGAAAARSRVGPAGQRRVEAGVETVEAHGAGPQRCSGQRVVRARTMGFFLIFINPFSNIIFKITPYGFYFYFYLFWPRQRFWHGKMILSSQYDLSC